MKKKTCLKALKHSNILKRVKFELKTFNFVLDFLIVSFFKNKNHRKSFKS